MLESSAQIYVIIYIGGEKMYNIIITKYADNDYSICVTDDVTDINSGCSVRGTLTETLEELDANSLNILKDVAKLLAD